MSEVSGGGGGVHGGHIQPTDYIILRLVLYFMCLGYNGSLFLTNIPKVTAFPIENSYNGYERIKQ